MDEARSRLKVPVQHEGIEVGDDPANPAVAGGIAHACDD
jgi:hypothetical protein